MADLTTVCLSATTANSTNHRVVRGEEATALIAQVQFSLTRLFEAGLSVRINDGQFVRRFPRQPHVFIPSPEQ